MNQQLARIIYDEAHVIVMKSSFRSHYGELILKMQEKYACIQSVHLTAILSISFLSIKLKSVFMLSQPTMRETKSSDCY